MIDLYYAPTANGKRAAVILAEADLPHRRIAVDFSAKPEELLKLNPLGHIPVIVDPHGPDGRPIVLTQSGAIMLYVAEKVGRFWPSDPRRRILAQEWFMLACSDVAGTSSAWFISGHDLPEPSAANTGFFETRLVRFFKACDQQLVARSYLADELSLADLALYPFVAGRMAMIEKAGGLDRLRQWAERLAARPGVRQGMAAA